MNHRRTRSVRVSQALFAVGLTFSALGLAGSTSTSGATTRSSRLVEPTQQPSSPEAKSLVWASPESVLVVDDWAPNTPARILDGTETITLTPTQRLFVPVENGRWVAADAPDAVQQIQLGLADGRSAVPDTILWEPLGTTSLRVPIWSHAGYVAIRTNRTTRLNLAQSTEPLAPLDWFVLDSRVSSWARSGAELPQVHQPEVARLLAALQQLREAIAAPRRLAAAPLLIGLWLEESLRTRSLGKPFFVNSLPSELEPQILVGPGRLEFPALVSDLHRWRLRAMGTTRVILREGRQIARVVEWRPRDPTSRTWSSPRSIRTIPLDPSSRPELEVVFGTVSASVQGFELQPEFREWFGSARRLRSRLWADSMPSLPRANTSQARSRGAPTMSALGAYAVRSRSLTAPRLDDAIEAAMTGILDARDAPWQALFGARLLDLGLLDTTLERGSKYEKLHRTANEKEAPALDQSRLPRRLLLEALLPAQLGRRPSFGDAAEAWAGAQPTDSLVTQLVQKYWQSFPYRVVAPIPGTPTVARLVPRGGEGLCDSTSDNAETWFVPAEKQVEFTVDIAEGSYAIATIRPVGDAPMREGRLFIDETPLTIHSGSGLSSRVALSRGRHFLTKDDSTPPLAIEVTSGMSVPCRQSFRWQRWGLLRPGDVARYPLPSPGGSSVARVRFDGLTEKARVTLDVDSRQFDLDLLPPVTGTVEIPVGSADSSLAISSSQPVSIAVHMRRESDADPPAASLPISTISAQQARTGATATRVLPPELLVELQKVGAALRSQSNPATVGQLRQHRAHLLRRLGFTSLANRDEDTPMEVDPSTDLVRIEGATDPAIPIGLLPTIAPLPLPLDSSSLVQRRQAWRNSGAADCAGELQSDSAEAPNAETLLAAYCAEKVGLSATAADHYARIAHSTKDPQTLLHAAALLADSAVAAQDRRLGLQAAIYAARAASWGGDAGGLRARLSDALHWITPSVVEGAAGVTGIAHGLAVSRSNRQLVLARLVDAPEDALLLEAGQSAEVLLNNRQSELLTMQYGCDVATGGEPCVPHALLDNGPIACTLPQPATACVLRVPEGKHRLRISFDGSESIGWVATVLGGRKVLPAIATNWAVLDAHRTAQLVVRGPTVLRLRVRGSGNANESLSIRGCGIEEDMSTLPLPQGVDLQARPWPSESMVSPIGEQVEKLIPVVSESVCQLRLIAHQANTRVRLSIARADGLPAPRLTFPSRALGAPAETLESVQEVVATGPEVRPQRLIEGLPLLIGARTRFVSESLSVALEQDRASSEGAFQDVYGEVSAIAARELIANRWWATGQAGVRFRNGPNTEFGRISLDMPARDGLAGIDLTGSVYSQSFGDMRSTTFTSTGRFSRRWDASPRVAIIPQIGFTTLRVGAAPSSPLGVDGDVFSRFHASHPRYASIAATLSTRPFVDVLFNGSISSRSLPRLDGLDRITTTAELVFLPVPHWPLLGGFDWMSSYRPASSLRTAPFVRHDLGLAWGLWHWITPSERIRWFGRVDFFFDAPAARLGNVILAPSIGLEILSSGARGLRDLSPQQAPMREFQERGSARVRSGRVGRLDEPLGAEATP